MMHAAILNRYDGANAITVETRPVPQPKRGEVLIKVAASPINPSDLLFVKGSYGFRKPLPVIPGFEGSGTIAAMGGGFSLYGAGTRVAFAVQERGDGPWADYVIMPAMQVFPLPKAVTLEQGAMGLVNPLTAIALYDVARRGGHKAFIQTAAAGALGQMIVRLSASERIDVLNIVRRPEQVATLRALGATHVLDSSASDFDQALREHCERLKIRLAFDAIAGTMPGRLLAAMPNGGRVTVYGALSEEAVQVAPLQLIFEGKSINGFWLSDWLRAKNVFQILRTGQRALSLLQTDLRSDVRIRYPVSGAADALRDYERQMSGGKVLIVPGG